MAWAKVDDGWWCHPKVMGLGIAARGLWVSALSWSCAQRRDVVPETFLAMVGASNIEAKELVEAGLWVPEADAWRIHDWAEYQDRSLSEKRADAGRKGGEASGRSRRAKASEATERSKGEANAEAGTHPSPTRPEENNDVAEAATVREVFNAWVASTGRHPTRTKLDNTRRGLIRRALKHYPLEDVLDAVRGWEQIPHNRGENRNGTVYNDLELLLRNSGNLERFRDAARSGADHRTNELGQVER